MKPEHFKRDPAGKYDKREPELFDDYLDLLNDENTETREDKLPTFHARVQVGIHLGAAAASRRMAPVARAPVAVYISTRKPSEFIYIRYYISSAQLFQKL